MLMSWLPARQTLSYGTCNLPWQGGTGLELGLWFVDEMFERGDKESEADCVSLVGWELVMWMDGCFGWVESVDWID